jgi:hypothetical protein
VVERDLIAPTFCGLRVIRGLIPMLGFFTQRRGARGVRSSVASATFVLKIPRAKKPFFPEGALDRLDHVEVVIPGRERLGGEGKTFAGKSRQISTLIGRT